MSSLTARFKYILSDYTDTADVGTIDSNFSAIDTLGVPNALCTVTTRPATPFTGMVIYETDTGFTRIWNGISLSWETLNAIRTTSVAARPVGSFIGDRLVETDTGIIRSWSGTRWKALGAGYAGSVEAVADQAGVTSIVDITGLNLPTVTFDGLTPVTLAIGVSSIVGIGTGITGDEQLQITIVDSINAAGSVEVLRYNLAMGHAVSGQLSTGGEYSRKYTPVAGTHVYKAQAIRTLVNGTCSFTLRAAPTYPMFMRVTEN